jgi:hypothetical protein
MTFSLPRFGEHYSPLYFLAALGNGGIAVAFFMMLFFWVPHPGQPVPIHEDIRAAFATGGLPMQAMIATALAGIAFFAFQHVRYLVWNLRSYAAWKGTAACRRLCASNAETQKTALPLTLAMAINVGFVLGLVLVPRLWTVVEYLFPAAIVAFLLVGILAFRQIGGFLGRVLVSGGGFSHSANNSYAQLLPAFALAMVGVGLAAPAAMSATPAIAGVAIVLSTFFMMAAALYGLVALVLGVHAMMEHGAAEEAAPTLMIVIPILTVLGILMLRQQHGLHVHFGVHQEPGQTLAFLGMLLSVQILFGLLGLTVLRRQHYHRKYLSHGHKSPGSYALICPGVALSVMLHFFTNQGLVAAGVIDLFGTAYWVLSMVAVAFMLGMIGLVWWLNRHHFGTEQLPGPALRPEPAE